MSPRDRRALMRGGVIVAAAVVCLRVVPAVARAASLRQRTLAERSALLARTRAELATAPALRDSAAVLTHALVALAPRLLSGSTVEEANADLAARLNLAAARSPARVLTLEPLPDSTTAGRLHAVRHRAVIESDVRGITAFLRRIAADDAALRLTHMQLTAVDPTAPRQRPEVLHTEVIVTGWFLDRPGPLPPGQP